MTFWSGKSVDTNLNAIAEGMRLPGNRHRHRAGDSSRSAARSLRMDDCETIFDGDRELQMMREATSALPEMLSWTSFADCIQVSEVKDPEEMLEKAIDQLEQTAEMSDSSETSFTETLIGSDGEISSAEGGTNGDGWSPRRLRHARGLSRTENPTLENIGDGRRLPRVARRNLKLMIESEQATSSSSTTQVAVQIGPSVVISTKVVASIMLRGDEPGPVVMLNDNDITYIDNRGGKVWKVPMNDMGNPSEFTKHGERFNRPSALAVSSCGSRFAIRDNDGLHILSSDGTLIASTKASSHSLLIHGVAAMPCQMFVTVDDYRKRLLFFDAMTGALVCNKRLPMEDMTPRGATRMMSTFQFIHADAYGPRGSTRVVLTDCGNGKVHVLNKDGDFQFSFGGEVNGTSCHPAQVASLPGGEFIVSDTLNDCNYVFDAAGNFQHTLIVPSGSNAKQVAGLHTWHANPATSALPLPFDGTYFLGASWGPPSLHLLKVKRR